MHHIVCRADRGQHAWVRSNRNFHHDRPCHGHDGSRGSESSGYDRPDRDQFQVLGGHQRGRYLSRTLAAAGSVPGNIRSLRLQAAHPRRRRFAHGRRTGCRCGFASRRRQRIGGSDRGHHAARDRDVGDRDPGVRQRALRHALVPALRRFDVKSGTGHDVGRIRLRRRSRVVSPGRAAKRGDRNFRGWRERQRSARGHRHDQAAPEFGGRGEGTDHRAFRRIRAFSGRRDRCGEEERNQRDSWHGLLVRAHSKHAAPLILRPAADFPTYSGPP